MGRAGSVQETRGTSGHRSPRESRLKFQVICDSISMHFVSYWEQKAIFSAIRGAGALPAAQVVAIPKVNRRKFHLKAGLNFLSAALGR